MLPSARFHPEAPNQQQPQSFYQNLDFMALLWS